MPILPNSLLFIHTLFPNLVAQAIWQVGKKKLTCSWFSREWHSDNNYGNELFWSHKAQWNTGLEGIEHHEWNDLAAAAGSKIPQWMSSSELSVSLWSLSSLFSPLAFLCTAAPLSFLYQSIFSAYSWVLLSYKLEMVHCNLSHLII